MTHLGTISTAIGLPSVVFNMSTGKTWTLLLARFKGQKGVSVCFCWILRWSPQLEYDDALVTGYCGLVKEIVGFQ